MQSKAIVSSLLACALGGSLVACNGGDIQPITGTSSLKVDLLTDAGTAAARLDPTALTTMVNITALDDQGNVDTTFNNELQVYVQFLGTLTPYLGGTPLATVQMTNGVATTQTITLPPVFGPTNLWFDDGEDTKPTYATGTTTTIWYRDPFIDDVQRPASETSLTALDDSPLENKNVAVNGSRNGSDGRLVVTSVFSQGYTVADVQCAAGGVAPCTAGDYDTIEVFSFSAPEDENGLLIHEGEVITGWAGGISEFDGLTEVGFPQTFVGENPPVDTSLEPPDYVLDASWFTNDIMFERAEAAALDVKNATVCPLDDDYTTYKQWKLALDGNCASTKTLINVISEGVVQLDPSGCVGKILPRVTGMLRPVNIGSFNVWLIYPRSSMDLQLPAGDATCTIASS